MNGHWTGQALMTTEIHFTGGDLHCNTTVPQWKLTFKHRVYSRPTFCS